MARRVYRQPSFIWVWADASGVEAREIFVLDTVAEIVTCFLYAVTFPAIGGHLSVLTLMFQPAYVSSLSLWHTAPVRKEAFICVAEPQHGLDRLMRVVSCDGKPGNGQ